MRKIWFFVILISLGVLFYLGYPRIAGYLERREIILANEAALSDVSTKASLPSLDTVKVPAPETLQPIPEKAYLDDVPFICQNPYRDAAGWKKHKESCEEAAFLQAYFFAKGTGKQDAQRLDSLITDMIDWQTREFGGHFDIYADSIKLFATRYFGLSEDEVVIIYDATLDDVRRHVAMGSPVIVPTFGRTLDNPYYTPPGPRYHMLTVIGYTKDRVITNDVGTRHGKDFTYPNDVFEKAMKQEGADVLVLKLKPVKE